jgi:ribonuclease BN (tRNA processing enzyme)
MQLLILGSGTIIQKGTAKNCSGYLLDKKILIDCGPGVWRALHQHGIQNKNISHILLSHFHVDHTSDLAPFLQERYLISANAEQLITIIGPPGLKEWLHSFIRLIGKWAADLDIRTIEIKNKSLDENSYRIYATRTLHTDNSVCYRIEKDNRYFFYSGDTDFDPGLQKLANNCHLAIIEASNTTETKLKGHLTPALAGAVAKASNIKKLILTHMYPEVLASNPGSEAASNFGGEILLAEDGLEITF